MEHCDTEVFADEYFAQVSFLCWRGQSLKPRRRVFSHHMSTLFDNLFFTMFIQCVTILIHFAPISHHLSYRISPFLIIFPWFSLGFCFGFVPLFQHFSHVFHVEVEVLPLGLGLQEMATVSSGATLGAPGFNGNVWEHQLFFSINEGLLLGKYGEIIYKSSIHAFFSWMATSSK